MQSSFCPYSKLDVHPEATSAEISSHFRKTSLENHPDKTTDPKEKAELSEIMKERTASYHLLTNPVKRKVFDHFVGTAKKNSKDIYSRAWEEAAWWTGQEDSFVGSELALQIEAAEKAQEKLAQEKHNRDELRKLASEARQRAKMTLSATFRKQKTHVVNTDKKESERVSKLKATIQQLQKEVLDEQWAKTKIEKSASEQIKIMKITMQQSTQQNQLHAARIDELEKLCARKIEESAGLKHLLQKSNEAFEQKQRDLNAVKGLLETTKVDLAKIQKQMNDKRLSERIKEELIQQQSSQADAGENGQPKRIQSVNQTLQKQQKLYKCKECDLYFNSPWILRRHRNTCEHDGQYNCREIGCNQIFSRKCALERHLKITHKQL